MAYVVPVSFSSNVKSSAWMFLFALIAGVVAESAFHAGNWPRFWWSTLAAVVCLALGLGNVLFLLRVTSNNS